MWTATEDCWCSAVMSAHQDGTYIAVVSLDNWSVARNANSSEIQVSFPVAKGQTVYKTNGNVTCYFYSMR